MGISAFGASGIKPGVCTSTTRPSAPYEGMMIYETDTNRVLIWDNAAWVMIADTDSPPGLELVKTQTVGSAVSSVTVTDAFNSSLTNYKIVVSGVDCSVGDNVLAFTLGSSTASYYSISSYYTFAMGLLEVNRYNAASAYLVASDTNNNTNFSFDIFQPYSAEYTSWSGSGFTYEYNITFGGKHLVASSYTSFTIATTTGTMTGGTIKVYGYRN